MSGDGSEQQYRGEFNAHVSNEPERNDEWEMDDEWRFPRCNLCASERPVAVTAVRYEMGDRFALPEKTPLCETCAGLFRASDSNALAARLTQEFEDFGRAAVVAHLLARGTDLVPIETA